MIASIMIMACKENSMPAIPQMQAAAAINSENNIKIIDDGYLTPFVFHLDNKYNDRLLNMCFDFLFVLQLTTFAKVINMSDVR